MSLTTSRRSKSQPQSLIYDRLHSHGIKVQRQAVAYPAALINQSQLVNDAESEKRMRHSVARNSRRSSAGSPVRQSESAARWRQRSAEADDS